MAQDVSSTIHNLTTQATVFGGFLTWVAANSSALTVIVFTVTGIASIIFGRINAVANKQRNVINKRNITEDIYWDLKRAGKSDQFIDEVKRAINN